jgi:TrmH family RNA methyltransferase
MITSTSNARIQWIRNLQRKRRARQDEGLFVVEGTRLGEEALRAGLTPRLILHAPDLDERTSTLVHTFARRGASILAVSARVLEACSSTEAPQGVLVVLPFPSLSLPARLTLAVIADGIADPGNLGTLLRTSWACGVEAIFLSPGTVDAYNPKVVRAAMGAHFHVPLVRDDDEGILQRLGGLAIWAGQPRGGLAYDRLEARSRLALIIGQEARGPGSFWRDHAVGGISIPMEGQVESLNAAIAAAVILFEVRRQRETPGDLQGTAPGRASSREGTPETSP